MASDGKKKSKKKAAAAAEYTNDNERLKAVRTDLKAVRTELKARERDIVGLNEEIVRLKAVVDELEQIKYDGFERDLIEALVLTPRVAHIIANMARHRGGGDEQHTDQHHILSTKEHHPFMKKDDTYRKSNDGDGRKTCCNIFFNDNSKRRKCNTKGYLWCVECTYMRGEAFYLCEGCGDFRNENEVRITPLHVQFPPPRSFWAERRYIKNLDQEDEEEDEQ